MLYQERIKLWELLDKYGKEAEEKARSSETSEEWAYFWDLVRYAEVVKHTAGICPNK